MELQIRESAGSTQPRWERTRRKKTGLERKREKRLKSTNPVAVFLVPQRLAEEARLSKALMMASKQKSLCENG